MSAEHGILVAMPEPIKVHGSSPVSHERPERFAWRARLRANPRTRTWFRVAIAVIGISMMIAAPLTGWLPGPGGIPLFLAGLGVLSTEFLWAKRFRKWLLRYVRIYLDWPTQRRRVFWVLFFISLGVFQWIYLANVGIPGWVPQWAAHWLCHLPGVD